MEVNNTNQTRINLVPNRTQDDLNGKLYVNRYDCAKGGGFAIFNRHMILVARGWEFVMVNCSFYIDQDLREKSLNEGIFTTHALLTGTLDFNQPPIVENTMRVVAYNPKKNAVFVYKDNGEAVFRASRVICVNPYVYV